MEAPCSQAQDRAGKSSWQTPLGRLRRQRGICVAYMLKHLAVHAAGLQEPAEGYVWESLHVTKWEGGAAKQFTRFTKALREYLLADNACQQGVLTALHLSRSSIAIRLAQWRIEHLYR